MSHTEVKVRELPNCDFCSEVGENRKAHYDGKTIPGPWAYMCDLHFRYYGVGIGLGKGQRLILDENKMTKPKLKLVGEDGNAFFILGKAQREAKRAGWPQEKIDEFMKKATSGNYDNLLAVVQDYFDVE